MSKYTAAKNYPPRGLLKGGRSIGKPKHVRAAAKLFVDDGAQSAADYLRRWGKSALLGAVFLRAKFLERAAKRLAAHAEFLASLRAPPETGLTPSGLPVPTGPKPIKGI
jgi:hypothetical protein